MSGVRIPLHFRGEVAAFAIVDWEDRALANDRWVLRTIAGRRYAERSASRQPKFLHRAVLGLGKGDPRHVDHINGDGLDNRRANLRIATTAENAQNQGSRGGSSSHRGVSWCNTRKRWLAQATLNGRKVNLGRYATEAEAARAASAFRAEHMPFSTDAKEAA